MRRRKTRKAKPRHGGRSVFYDHDDDGNTITPALQSQPPTTHIFRSMEDNLLLSVEIHPGILALLANTSPTKRGIFGRRKSHTPCSENFGRNLLKGVNGTYMKMLRGDVKQYRSTNPHDYVYVKISKAFPFFSSAASLTRPLGKERTTTPRFMMLVKDPQTCQWNVYYDFVTGEMDWRIPIVTFNEKQGRYDVHCHAIHDLMQNATGEGAITDREETRTLFPNDVPFQSIDVVNHQLEPHQFRITDCKTNALKCAETVQSKFGFLENDLHLRQLIYVLYGERNRFHHAELATEDNILGLGTMEIDRGHVLQSEYGRMEWNQVAIEKYVKAYLWNSWNRYPRFYFYLSSPQIVYLYDFFSAYLTSRNNTPITPLMKRLFSGVKSIFSRRRR